MRTDNGINFFLIFFVKTKYKTIYEYKKIVIKKTSIVKEN